MYNTGIKIQIILIAHNKLLQDFPTPRGRQNNFHVNERGRYAANPLITIYVFVLVDTDSKIFAHRARRRRTGWLPAKSPVLLLPARWHPFCSTPSPSGHPTVSTNPPPPAYTLLLATTRSLSASLHPEGMRPGTFEHLPVAGETC